MNERDWNAFYAANRDPWTVPDPVLTAAVENLDPGRALDLGCGEGADSLWLAARGWRVTAVDGAVAAIATLRKLATERGLLIDGIVADVCEYSSEDRFDLVVMCYLHLPGDRRSRLLANAAAALRAGGTLLYVGVAPSDEWESAANQRLATPSEIVAELGDLVVERAEVEHRPVRHPEGTTVCDGVIVRAKRGCL